MDGTSPDIASKSSAPTLGEPTLETYDDLNRACRFFNERLFGGVLQSCLITLRARGRYLGYFSENRFVHPDGRRTHEIALNPEQFGYHTLEQCLSTLVHEQVHQWQFQDGTGGRRKYHNKDFARRMEQVGLIASATGKPGGAQTGEHMTHYIAMDGPFLAVVRELVDAGFRARWADRFLEHVSREYIEGDDDGIEPPDDGDGDGGGYGTPEPLPAPAPAPTPAPIRDLVDDDDAEPTTPRPPPPSFLDDRQYPGGTPPPLADHPDGFVVGKPVRIDTSKCKFVCPTCQAAAWGKQSLSLICGDCNATMPNTTVV